MVVHEGRDAPIRVVLDVLRRLVFALSDVEIDAVVAESELSKHKCDLPVTREHCETIQTAPSTARNCSPAVWAAGMRIQRELLSVRHVRQYLKVRE